MDTNNPLQNTFCTTQQYSQVCKVVDNAEFVDKVFTERKVTIFVATSFTQSQDVTKLKK